MDFVVVLSHNNVGYNKELLQAAPDAYVIVSVLMDHLKLVCRFTLWCCRWMGRRGLILGTLSRTIRYWESSLKKRLLARATFSGQNKKLKTPKKGKNFG